MPDLVHGDVVSLSRSEIWTLTVGGPALAAEVYSVTLPVPGGSAQVHSVVATGGESARTIAIQLAALIMNDQTTYQVVLDPTLPVLAIVGPLGAGTFSVTTTSNILPSLDVPGVVGDPAGLLKVLVVGNVEGLAQLHFWTREAGEIVERNYVAVRELGTAELHRVETSQILTIVERAP